MSARVLLVDDIDANRRVLAAKLAHDYHHVIEASGGRKAIELARDTAPDVILLDIMMPGLDGYETCRLLKTDPQTRHIPVVMVSSLDERIDRLRAFEVGADDFLQKPVDTAQLLARVRSLARVKIVIDELRTREANGRRLGVIGAQPVFESGYDARVLVIGEDDRESEAIVRDLRPQHVGVRLKGDGPPPETLDLVIAPAAARAFDGLALISRLNADAATRRLPILALANPQDAQRAMRALDVGAHDVIYRPPDPDELCARVRAIVRRKRQVDAMRAALDGGLELAVTDQLTGLYNRRYAGQQLEALVARAALGGDPVSILLLDIDFFKRINDAHGHGAGDEVLREFSARLATAFRAVDFACRFGGEEFLVILPNTRGDFACLIAERFRRQIAAAPFRVAPGEMIAVTTSIGVAATRMADTPEALLRRADEALYSAKADGRNRIASAAAAGDAGPRLT